MLVYSAINAHDIWLYKYFDGLKLFSNTHFLAFCLKGFFHKYSSSAWNVTVSTNTSTGNVPINLCTKTVLTVCMASLFSFIILPDQWCIWLTLFNCRDTFCMQWAHGAFKFIYPSQRKLGIRPTSPGTGFFKITPYTLNFIQFHSIFNLWKSGVGAMKLIWPVCQCRTLWLTLVFHNNVLNTQFMNTLIMVEITTK